MSSGAMVAKPRQPRGYGGKGVRRQLKDMHEKKEALEVQNAAYQRQQRHYQRNVRLAASSTAKVADLTRCAIDSKSRSGWETAHTAQLQGSRLAACIT